MNGRREKFSEGAVSLCPLRLQPCRSTTMRRPCRSGAMQLADQARVHDRNVRLAKLIEFKKD